MTGGKHADPIGQIDCANILAHSDLIWRLPDTILYFVPGRSFRRKVVVEIPISTVRIPDRPRGILPRLM